MPNAAVVALTVSVLLQTAPAGNRPRRRVTFTGCVQATGKADEFLLTVPAEYPEAVRGIAKGQPVPADSGAGPQPRPDPLTTPPRNNPTEPGLPEGRYATPTIVNHSYRLDHVKPARLKPLVGKAVEVVGDIPVEGFPNGDVPPSPQGVPPLNPSMNVTRLRPLGKSCTALLQSR
jgi:hypothetical protein